jgi:hypothetical protein
MGGQPMGGMGMNQQYGQPMGGGMGQPQYQMGGQQNMMSQQQVGWNIFLTRASHAVLCTVFNILLVWSVSAPWYPNNILSLSLIFLIGRYAAAMVAILDSLNH